ncbi:MAG: bifunctional alpha/beta hydrolase/OsmC family protein [Alphaproteobacteria bacterium]|nr:bifunctional alpha/beta hydrolase/OsmC family protein [Alphaproteobacteria bacterium]
MPSPQRISFDGANGHELAARLDLPTGEPRAYALFAHCFTCSKDLAAARRIAQGLAGEGIGVLRFDFTGLGHSDGEFANTNFSSNVADLLAATDYMRRSLEAPAILIGHSLGGAAVLAAAGQIAEVRAVATIGAPSDVGHVLHQLGSSLEEVRDKGEASVKLGGRPFTIQRQFVEDAEKQNLASVIGAMKKALLVLHSPLDETVGVDNATDIFVAAKHPKSFISLDNADHLLTDAQDAAYAARVIAAWAARFLPAETEPPQADEVAGVVVSETGQGKFQNAIRSGRHRLLADEPASVGGQDSGPSPYDYLAVALGACTAMTLRIYAERKKLTLPAVTVGVTHGKVASAHCDDCGAAADGREGRIDRFERVISFETEIDPSLHEKIIEIAGKCPVHRTLEAGSAVVTKIHEDAPGE